jgi:hypothetical protein
MWGHVCSKNLPHPGIFPQVFFADERGYHPMAITSAKYRFVIVNARSIGYVGDG